MTINLYLSYIPIFITKQHLYSMCMNLNLFSPLNIVLKPQKNNNFNTAYVFVKSWHNCEESRHILHTLQTGNNAYLQFAFPIYIKCSLLKKTP